MNIIKGDKVMIMKGKDRGKSGKVLSISPKENTLIIENLNLYKKSIKPKRQGEKGQIVSAPRPVRLDNVMMVCSSCGKPSRTGSKVTKDKKERYCKKCNAIV